MSNISLIPLPYRLCFYLDMQCLKPTTSQDTGFATGLLAWRCDGNYHRLLLWQLRWLLWWKLTSLLASLRRRLLEFFDSPCPITPILLFPAVDFNVNQWERCILSRAWVCHDAGSQFNEEGCLFEQENAPCLWVAFFVFIFQLWWFL